MGDIMKTKILVLGNQGMLGSQVVKVLSANKEFAVSSTNRTDFDPVLEGDLNFPGYDYVINCVGVIKPAMNRDIASSIFVNAVFPHSLANSCKKAGQKLIHITTDCVYSGVKGSYVESSLHDALDEYGKSKSLGEPKNCMVLRTSIIGPEIQNYRSLIAWFLKQTGECNGFINHFWNGITTKEYAKVCEKIILNGWYKEDLYHIFSDAVSKYEMLLALKYKFQKDIAIYQHFAHPSVDRTLATEKGLNSKLKISSFQEMINEM